MKEVWEFWVKHSLLVFDLVLVLACVYKLYKDRQKFNFKLLIILAVLFFVVSSIVGYFIIT